MEGVKNSDLKSSVNGGVVDVYGEDSATVEHSITPWSLSVLDAGYNKGLAFSEKERDTHYLRGLLPFLHLLLFKIFSSSEVKRLKLERESRVRKCSEVTPSGLKGSDIGKSFLFTFVSGGS
ncbi:PREDICTED: NADP-dependent malic enzyme 1-like [Brassica oleracea var. oleracea]|uniref:NADP-dependent malic enzyme 1-like n=1 Tax=Brassica oleracea var. oleracea TaxID=109376 RepID=UPI0006A706B9|nr:PREDICTED: NADP-dependent malic enzyme 1-like [Brassica oleracea var. oleracea]